MNGVYSPSLTRQHILAPLPIPCCQAVKLKNSRTAKQSTPTSKRENPGNSRVLTDRVRGDTTDGYVRSARFGFQMAVAAICPFVGQPDSPPSSLVCLLFGQL